MSTVSNKIFTPSNESESKLPSMPKAADTLAAFISRVRRDKDLTFQQIADASGGRISPNYVHNLEKGASTENLGGRKIVGLARGLGESPVVVFRLAMGLTGEVKDESFSQMIEEYSALSRSDQDDLHLMIKLLRDEIFKRRKSPTAK